MAIDAASAVRQIGDESRERIVCKEARTQERIRNKKKRKAAGDRV